MVVEEQFHYTYTEPVSSGPHTDNLSELVGAHGEKTIA